MSPAKPLKTIVQCDFDGTITIEDVSFALLDAFTPAPKWREFLEECRKGNITVGAFNSRAFGMVTAGEKTLLDFVGRTDFGIRPGLRELLDTCAQRGIEFAVVSHGLDFYIKAILNQLGIRGVPVFAAKSRFNAHGMEVAFIGPEGQVLDDQFKEAYVEHFRKNGYRVLYAGNGPSDLPAARRADHIFATSYLLKDCRELGLKCTPFEDLREIANGLPEALDQA